MAFSTPAKINWMKFGNLKSKSEMNQFLPLVQEDISKNQSAGGA